LEFALTQLEEDAGPIQDGALTRMAFEQRAKRLRGLIVGMPLDKAGRLLEEGDGLGSRSGRNGAG
jgi:hypothetical protein